MPCIIDAEHQAQIALWFVLQHSLGAYRKLLQHFSGAETALETKAKPQWQMLALRDQHLQRFDAFHSAKGQQAWQQCLQQLSTHCDAILLEHDTLYPQSLLPYDDRPPMLFVQGQVQALLQAQVAIVGSRKPSPRGKQVAYDFAHYLASQGFYITSGLAQGIDEAAHRGGMALGRSVAVMATGIDSTYPPQHSELRQQIVAQGGAVISEFLPQTKPLQYHFPRRNRIVSALSLGVVVAEATLKSGSLITAKLALDQGKTVFAIPGHIYDAHYAGCHQLIRDGAILVDHPQQIVDELALPTAWQQQQYHSESAATLSHPNDVIPEDLQTLYQHLDWAGLAIDQLAMLTALPTAELTYQLMQLELLGYCVQHAGLYSRCRRSDGTAQ